MIRRDPSLNMVSPVTLSGNILKEEGMRGLYQEISATWCREIPGCFCFFLSYEGTKSAICWVSSKEKEDITIAQNMVCGSMSGAAFWTVMFPPVDSIKSIIQVSGSTGTISDVAKEIMRIQGPQGPDSPTELVGIC
jgi:hypothetical protein